LINETNITNIMQQLHQFEILLFS